MKRNALLFILLCTSVWSCQSNEGWETLFDGKTLEGWHIYGHGKNYNGWYVDEGVLVFDPEERTEAFNANLTTDKQYSSFELSLDWMISEHGNSGLMWGVVEADSYEHPYQTGAEIQILDDGWSEYVNERGDINRAGSLYNLMPPSKVVSKGAGEWNSYLLHIDHDKNEGFLDFNGKRVLEFPVNGSEWKNLIEQSPFSAWEGFGSSKKGHISLQEHGGKVAFRRLKIRELNQ
ncbi:glycosyl hydrolase [Roseivirga spongicola]|uniref:Glycosyl hydrolase n=1 Tax=Roseivirga spongicola TaxID=333140 RepID=A0A150XB20_9BACT|nr:MULTISPECIES: DUF1080 domain-containing protein [Roseivirga]KYG75918.1 glycosyl hydrolase [Roseivirga spongicola]MBO6495589.1 DUF1080 domain-containing protein [Roseivirga sp.]